MADENAAAGPGPEQPDTYDEHAMVHKLKALPGADASWVVDALSRRLNLEDAKSDLLARLAGLASNSPTTNPDPAGPVELTDTDLEIVGMADTELEGTDAP